MIKSFLLSTKLVLNILSLSMYCCRRTYEPVWVLSYLQKVILPILSRKSGVNCKDVFVFLIFWITLKKSLKIPQRVIWIRRSKDRQHNAKRKRTNNDLQNTMYTHKSKTKRPRNTNPTNVLSSKYVLLYIAVAL